MHSPKIAKPVGVSIHAPAPEPLVEHAAEHDLRDAPSVLVDHRPGSAAPSAGAPDDSAGLGGPSDAPTRADDSGSAPLGDPSTSSALTGPPAPPPSASHPGDGPPPSSTPGGGPPVQRTEATPVERVPERDVQRTAHAGLSGPGEPLPHLSAIQRSFGHHSLGGVRAYTDGRARDAAARIGAKAYATGHRIAFRTAPDLHTVAHEAAHVVQQRQPVQLTHGVGKAGDRYEQNADEVADLVVRGQSAAHKLDEILGRTRPLQPAPAGDEPGPSGRPVVQKLSEDGHVDEEEEQHGAARRGRPHASLAEAGKAAGRLSSAMSARVQSAAKRAGSELGNATQPLRKQAAAAANRAGKAMGSAKQKILDATPETRKKLQGAKAQGQKAIRGLSMGAGARFMGVAKGTGGQFHQTERAGIGRAKTLGLMRTRQPEASEAGPGGPASPELASADPSAQGPATSQAGPRTAGAESTELAPAAAEGAHPTDSADAGGHSQLRQARAALGRFSSSASTRLGAAAGRVGSHLRSVTKPMRERAARAVDQAGGAMASARQKLLDATPKTRARLTKAKERGKQAILAQSKWLGARMMGQQRGPDGSYAPKERRGVERARVLGLARSPGADATAPLTGAEASPDAAPASSSSEVAPSDPTAAAAPAAASSKGAAAPSSTERGKSRASHTTARSETLRAARERRQARARTRAAGKTRRAEAHATKPQSGAGLEARPTATQSSDESRPKGLSEDAVAQFGESATEALQASKQVHASAESSLEELQTAARDVLAVYKEGFQLGRSASAAQKARLKTHTAALWQLHTELTKAAGAHRQLAALHEVPVQRKEAPSTAVQRESGPSSASDSRTHAASLLHHAHQGISGAGGPLPHAKRIQAAFGRHDIRHVRAHTDASAATANERLGSTAYAKGSSIAFSSPRPSLHTAAHEAAHVVQQASGLVLPGGMGRSGDVHEQHADAVAARVTRGQSAEDLLDRYGRTPASMRERQRPADGAPVQLATSDGFKVNVFGKTVTFDGSKLKAKGGGKLDLSGGDHEVDTEFEIPIMPGFNMTVGAGARTKLTGKATWKASGSDHAVNLTGDSAVKLKMEAGVKVGVSVGAFFASAGGSGEALLEATPEANVKVTGGARVSGEGSDAKWVTSDLALKITSKGDVKAKGAFNLVAKAGTKRKTKRYKLKGKTLGRFSFNRTIKLVEGGTPLPTADQFRQLAIDGSSFSGTTKQEPEEIDVTKLSTTERRFVLQEEDSQPEEGYDIDSYVPDPSGERRFVMEEPAPPEEGTI